MFKKFLLKKKAAPQEEFSASSGEDGLEQDLVRHEEDSLAIDADSDISIEGDVQQETDNQKTKGTFKGTMRRILIGFAVVIAGGLIFMVGRALSSGIEVVPISAAIVSPKNDKEVVYLSGSLNPVDLSDPLFNLSFKGLGLERVVEMYQWAPEGVQYVKKWSEELIKITDEPAKGKGFINPEELPLHSEKWLADKVTIGSFSISPALFAKLSIQSELMQMMDENFKKLPPEGQMAFKLVKGGYFFGLDPEKPNIGDLRVSFKSSGAAAVSIVAQQVGGSLNPYIGKKGAIGILRQGNADLKILLKDVDLETSFLTLLISLLMACLFGVIGVFIIIGKNPLSRNKSRSKNVEESDRSQKKQKKHTDKKEEEVVQEAISEETNFIENDDFNEYESDVDGSFMEEPNNTIDVNNIDTSPESYDVQNNILDEIKHNIAPPPSSHELEFTSPDQKIEVNEQFLNEQLQEFGIVDKNGDKIPDSHDMQASNVQQDALENSFASQEIKEPEHSGFGTTGGLDFELGALNSGPEVVENQALSLVYEVPVQELQLDQGLELDLPKAIHEEVPVAVPEPSSEAARVAYNDSEVQDYSEMPENVAFLAEIELEQDVRPEKKQARSEDTKPTPFIDFYPEKNDTLKQEAVIASGGVQEEVVIGGLINQGLQNISAEELITDGQQAYNMPASPPKPNYNQAVTNENTLAGDLENRPAPAPKIIPPPPDLESLLAYVSPPSIVKAKVPEHAVKAKVPEPTFDLPPLPGDFDPSVEMQSPHTHESPLHEDYNNVEGEAFSPEEDDAHSPFGDSLDDPFATHDNENK